MIGSGFILASASRARQLLLQNAGFSFDIVPADVDEDKLKKRFLSTGGDVEKLAHHLASQKASHVARQFPERLVVGADQTLLLKDQLLNKVDDLASARAQLRTLQGREHHLISAVSCHFVGDEVFRHSATACLQMKRLQAQDIDDYLAEEGDRVLGSVGCYRIEGPGIRLISRLSGDFFTIVGLPLVELVGFLVEFDPGDAGKLRK